MAVGRSSLPKTTAAPTVMYDQLLKLFRGSVFICAGAIAEKAASQEAKVSRQRMKKSGVYKERVSFNHPCVRLLQEPHPRLTAFDMHYQNFGWLQICGDAYMHKQKNGFGIPVRLNPLSPQWVQLIPGNENFVEAYRVNSQYLGTQQWDINHADMLHFQKKSLDWSSNRRFYGFSTIIAAENTIQLEAEMLSRLRHKFSNLSNPGLIFKTQRRLNEAQLKQNLDAIWSQHRLAEHEGKPMLVHDDMELISGADGKVQELDYRGSLEDTLRITSAAFGIPLTVVGLMGDQNRCHDDKTECMTDCGWVKYDKLSLSSRIACYDPESEEIVYKTPSNIFVNDYSGEMIHFNHRCGDILVTPNHRMWSKPQMPGKYAKPWSFREASECAVASNMSVLVAPKNGTNSTNTDYVVIDAVKVRKEGRGRTASVAIKMETWLKFLGWFVSEGCISFRSINNHGKCVTILSQKKSDGCKKIESLLEEMPFSFSKSFDKKTECYSWHCSDRGLYEHLKAHCYTDRYQVEWNDPSRPQRLGSYCKKAPDYIHGLSSEMLSFFLESAIDGDGHRNGSNNGKHRRAQYGTTSEKLADDIQEFAVKCGYWATKSKQDIGEKGCGYLYRIGISFTRNHTTFVPSRQVSSEKYVGKVWCVEVPTGLFIVRRNGCVHISGNSSAEASLYSFANNKLNPMLTAYSQTLTNQLGKDFYDEDLIIEIGPFNVRDYKEMVNASQALWRAGAITPNEIRDHLLGMPPLDFGGDTPVLPAGVMQADYGNTEGRGQLNATGDENGRPDATQFAGYFPGG